MYEQRKVTAVPPAQGALIHALLPGSRAFRKLGDPPWPPFSLPAMVMPQLPKESQKYQVSRSVPSVTRPPRSLTRGSLCNAHSSYSKPSPPRAPSATSYPLFLADGLASYFREKIEAIRLVRSLLPTLSPSSSAPGLAAFLPSQNKGPSEADISTGTLVPNLLNLLLDLI